MWGFNSLPWDQESQTLPTEPARHLCSDLTLYWLKGYSHHILNRLSLLNWFQKSMHHLIISFTCFWTLHFGTSFAHLKIWQGSYNVLFLFLEFWGLFLPVHFIGILLLIMLNILINLGALDIFSIITILV